jgi:hypothetical protein
MARPQQNCVPEATYIRFVVMKVLESWIASWFSTFYLAEKVKSKETHGGQESFKGWLTHNVTKDHLQYHIYGISRPMTIKRQSTQLSDPDYNLITATF